MTMTKTKNKIWIACLLVMCFCMPFIFSACGGNSKTNQATLTITAVATKEYGDADFQLQTTGGSGAGAVTYTRKSGDAATVSSAGLVHITGAGEVKVTATKAADNTYKEITSAEMTISIEKATGSGTLTVQDYNNMDAGSTIDPTVVSSTHEASSAIFYYKEKRAEDNTYTTDEPAALGEYVVKAVLPENSLYKELVLTEEFNVYSAWNIACTDFEYQFSFVAEKTGYYKFTSDDALDSYVSIDHDSNKPDQYFEFTENGFMCVAFLTAGETYDLSFVTNESVDFSFTVTMTYLYISEFGSDFEEAKAICLEETVCMFSFRQSSYFYYSFTPDEDGLYIFESAGDADPQITLYTYDGDEYIELGYNDDGGEEANFRYIVSLEKETEYFIEIYFYDAGLSCFTAKQVSVSDFGTDFADARAICLDQPVYMASLTEHSEFFYSFTPDEEGLYIFESIGEADPEITLYTYDGDDYIDFGGNDDGGEEFNFYYRAYLEKDVKYYIIIYFHDIGPSHFTVSQVNLDNYHVTDYGTSFDDAKAISLNQIVYMLSFGEDTEVYYSFTPSEDGTYIFESAGDLDPKITLYTYDGDDYIEVDDDDDSGEENNFKCIVDLEKDAKYFIAIYFYDAGLSNFTVKSYTVENVYDFITPVSLETDIEDKTTEKERCFKIEITKTGTYAIKLDETVDGHVEFYVVDNDFNDIDAYWRNENGYDYLVLTLTAGKTYYIIRHYDGNNFRYQYTFQVVPNAEWLLPLMQRLSYYGLEGLEQFLGQLDNITYNFRDYTGWQANLTDSKIAELTLDIKNYILESGLELYTILDDGEVEVLVREDDIYFDTYPFAVSIIFYYLHSDGVVYEVNLDFFKLNFPDNRAGSVVFSIYICDYEIAE